MLPLDPKNRAADPAAAQTGADRLPPGLVPVPLPAPWATGPDFGGASGSPGLSAPGMGNMVQALRRRWPVLLVLGLLGAALAAGAVWYLVPGKYVTQALVEMERPPRGAVEGDFDLIAFKKTQAALLKSDPVLQAALRDPRVTNLPEVRAQADPVGWLAKNLVTDDLLGPAILRVTLSGDNARELPEVLNAVVKAYLAEFGRNERAKVEERSRQLKVVAAQVSKDLLATRGRFQNELNKHPQESPEARAAQLQGAQQQLTNAQTLLFTKQAELSKAEQELAAVKARLKDPDTIAIADLAVEEELRKEAVYNALQQQLALVEAAIQDGKATLNPQVQDAKLRGEYIRRKSIQRNLEVLTNRLSPRIIGRLRDKEVALLKDQEKKLEGEVRFLREQKDKLDENVRGLQANVSRIQFAGAPDRLPPALQALRDDVEQKETVWKRINDELAALQVGAASPRVTVRETAKVPTGKDLKRQIKLAGLAGGGTFALVFLGVVWLESRHRRVYAADDVVQGLGINLVGTLPALPASARRAVATAAKARDVYWQNLMTESVDVIRTVLLHTAQAEKLRVVMVTSAVGGEGKTSLASHLAVSLARAWRKTLLIDCDLRNPAAHQLFDAPLEPGLSEVLRGEVELDDVLRPTPVSRLWLVAAGKWDSHAIQALAQEEVRGLFDRLRDQYDFIVIDSCPVLPVADSLLIGQHADAALFAVLRDVSRMPAVHAAHQRLAALGIRMLGAVVVGERVDSSSPSYQYLMPSSEVHSA